MFHKTNTDNTITKTSHNLDDVFSLKNCLSSEKIHWLRSSMETLRADPDAAKDRAVVDTKKNKIFMIHKTTSLHNEVETLFKSLFPLDSALYRIHSANFYEIETAYALHCDNLGPELGFFQAIIPLNVEPSINDTYTIVFDQTSDINSEWISPVYKKSKDYKPFHNKPIYDANWFGNWSDEYRIPEEDGVKFWGSTWDETFRESYKGFSIKHAYRWSIGDIFIFNSKYTHCASELSKLGINKKSGLLLCLSKVV